jgi:hypothetical protein
MRHKDKDRYQCNAVKLTLRRRRTECSDDSTQSNPTIWSCRDTTPCKIWPGYSCFFAVSRQKRADFFRQPEQEVSTNRWICQTILPTGRYCFTFKTQPYTLKFCLNVVACQKFGVLFLCYPFPDGHQHQFTRKKNQKLFKPVNYGLPDNCALLTANTRKVFDKSQSGDFLSG